MACTVQYPAKSWIGPVPSALFSMALLAVPTLAAEKTPLPAAHTTRTIEGWTVRVDDRLLQGQQSVAGALALKLLAARLVAITVVVPEKSLAQLRTITIELDLNYGDLRAMQYHPDAGWCSTARSMARCS
jgi:hypothetical protein